MMLKQSRRGFLKIGSAALAGSGLLRAGYLYAQTLKLPLGLQLYSVRTLLPSDYDGTLKRVESLGYREVEAAGYYSHSADEVREAMRDANLKLVSAHYSSDDLHKQLDQIISFNKELDVRYLICSFPGFKDPARVQGLRARERVNAFTLDDWRWNAEQFNLIGAKVRSAGMKFGYHNHTMEFHEMDGVVPYVELMRLTDPAVVTMEMDCGWVIVGGGNPVELLQRYPTRITMLHLKDFKQTSGFTSIGNPPVATELGQGVIDYRPILRQAAIAGHIRHCFVEQEQFDMPPFQSLKIDAEYVNKLESA
jgi:sugar phosphate isomerase/epimerase